MKLRPSALEKLFYTPGNFQDQKQDFLDHLWKFQFLF